MTTNPQILASHALFTTLAGPAYAVSLDYGRERMWYEWLKRFNDSDLRIVIRYLQAQIRKGERKPGCLKFHNLIGSPDLTEEDIALARATQRNARPPRTDRDQVQIWGKQAEPVQHVKTPADILEKGYNELRKATEL